MEITDIKDMPEFNVAHGDEIESVSEGKVILKDGYPWCVRHGAMNKVAVTRDGGGIWRCVTTYRIWLFPNGKPMDKESNACAVGCYQGRET